MKKESFNISLRMSKSILSQPDKEIIGENIFHYVHDEDIEKVNHALEFILKEPEQIKKVEIRVVRLRFNLLVL